jgi:hypothetical protein
VQRVEIVLRDVQRPEIREVKKPAEGFDRVGLEVQRLEADVVFQVFDLRDPFAVQMEDVVELRRVRVPGGG